MSNTNVSMAATATLEIPNRERTTQAFGQVLSSHRSFLYRKAYRMLGNAADAEDAVQDALLAAFVHLDQFKGQSEMSTWVIAILHNCVRLQFRRRLRHVDVSLDEPIGESQTLSVSEQIADHRPSPEDECQHSQLRTRLTHLYKQLSPTLRRAFWLRDIGGLSIRETARILKVPCGTVKARSARARKQIKKFLQRAPKPLPKSQTIIGKVPMDKQERLM